MAKNAVSKATIWHRWAKGFLDRNHGQSGSFPRWNERPKRAFKSNWLWFDLARVMHRQVYLPKPGYAEMNTCPAFNLAVWRWNWPVAQECGGPTTAHGDGNEVEDEAS